MFENLKKILQKTDFDTTRRNIKTYNYHYILGLGLIANGVSYVNKNNIWRLALPLLGFSLNLLSLSMMWINFFHSLDEKNIPEMSESLSIIVISNLILIQQICLLKNINVVYKIVDSLDRDFAEMDTAPEDYRDIFYKNQLRIWQMSIACVVGFFAIAVIFSLGTVCEMIHQQLYHDYYPERGRVFIFKIWLPYDDVYRTPVYHVFFIVEHMVAMVIVNVIAVYVSLLVQFIIHPLAQMDMIILAFKQLFDFGDLEKGGLNLTKEAKRHELKRRLAKIVQRHNRVYEFCEDSAKIFGPSLLYQILATPMELCVSAFQVSDGLENGQYPLLFISLFWGSTFQLYIPCQLGSMLIEKVSEVGDACYSCGWEEHDVHETLGKDIQIFIMRANKKLTVNAFGIATVSLETFSSILKTAGSYFTMLRQINENT